MLKLTQPLNLLLAAAAYTLGASVPVYLGKPFQALPFLLGLGGILFAQLAMALLGAVFRPHNEPLLPDQTPGQKEDLRRAALQLSIAALASAGLIVYLLFTLSALSTRILPFLLLSLALVLAYAIPPIRLLERGFGELALALHLAYVTPSIACLLQSGSQHRLLIFTILPLTALALAYFLLLNFLTFPEDQKYQRATLLRRMGWERAVLLHHALLILAYAIFAFALLLHYAPLWVAFLTLPFAILQGLLLRGISLGAKPNWRLLTTTALAVFILTIYLVTLSFWFH